MQYEIVQLESKKVVGLVKKTSNINKQSIQDIGALWQEFMMSGIYMTIQNKVGKECIGLYTDYEGDFTKPYLFMTCCAVDSLEDVEKPLIMRTIRGGKYAKFTVRGPMQQVVGEAWKAIWSMDLDRKYEDDFEVYHNNSEDMTDEIIDIYISLK